MISPWRRTVISIFAGLLVILAALFALPGGQFLALRTSPFVLTALGFIVVGELVIVMQRGRQLSPVSIASAMALALAPAHQGAPLTWAQLVLAVAIAMAIGAVILRVARRPSDLFDQSARLIGIALSAGLARVDVGSRSVLDWVADPRTGVMAALLALTGVAFVGVFAELVLWTVGRVRSLRVPVGSLISYDLARSGAIGSIMTNAGAVIAVCTPAIGTLAIPLFLWPIVLALYGLRRAGRVEATQRQLVLALSRLTDETGHTAKGHARRVARIAQAMGEDLGLAPLDLEALHDAALLHDVGQVTLTDPIPDGATVLAAPAEQAHVLRQTINLAEHAGSSALVIEAIAASGAQFRQLREHGEPIPKISRILKVANAYDDLTHGRRSARGPALERIHLGLGYEYDPAVVDALTRVTEYDARPPR